MNHYLEIRVRPDPELPAVHVMSKLLGKLHSTLAIRRSTDIGISFPRLASDRRSLGDVLRLHGSVSALDTLLATPFMTGLHDHVQATILTLVPTRAQHRHVRRLQTKSSVERLRRRQMRRHGYSEAEALERVPESVERRLEQPYLTVRSASTGQSFPLFIEHGPLLDSPQSGSFSTYGLSLGATVPWF